MPVYKAIITPYSGEDGKPDFELVVRFFARHYDHALSVVGDEIMPTCEAPISQVQVEHIADNPDSWLSAQMNSADTLFVTSDPVSEGLSPGSDRGDR